MTMCARLSCSVAEPPDGIWHQPRGDSPLFTPDELFCSVLCRNREWRRRYQRALRDQDAEGVRTYQRNMRLRTKYGISRQEFDRMLREQSGRCAICRDRFGSKICVDHNHTTGDVRGLLCSTCNQGIGYFEDNAALLREAAKYLDKYQ